MVKQNEYPFIMRQSKLTNEKVNFTIETPWLDEGEFETRVKFEKVFSESNPFIEVSKIHYDNGFKMMILETPDYIAYRSNWELDELPNGNLLPRIQ
ncbi:TPA: hypothetical protein O1956_001867 [Staphylococcus aureus]|uniref:hypothetical protein n=1 Tax=Staphylococcus aureus TaxID=1280 RepID=UPI00085CAECA|nr:hypothetical protein [Staphylococcus aureus]SCU37712.1 Uncharacterised protein [Staphylococcus aureus]HCY8319032.1 hypothetical protein [Staphylococcus aureus]HDA1660304.1 hypothetical protein [Staphylococcus aureus]HDA2515613.1 hypothetical protein [Staphylococcus aureus]HDJ1601774.1 hypothetical protein [Staphylococcus aureus]